jgi:tetratricopeptide (TPR) repeat protein
MPACRTTSRIDDASTVETLNQVSEHLQEDRFTEAETVLDSVDMRQLNPYERAIVYQLYGYLANGREDYAKAAEYFEKALAEDALPPATATTIRFNIAQLYIALERWEDAIKALEQWFAESEAQKKKPDSNAYYTLAVAYYQLATEKEDETLKDKALDPAKKAVEIATEPQERWLQMLLALYLEKNDYQNALPVLEQLVSLYPKETYWTQLVHILAKLGRWEEFANLLKERSVEVSDWVLVGASADGRSDVVKLLAARGADLDARGTFGTTALHQAARAGHEETVRLLLDLGADPYVTDASGRTAAQLAAENGHQAVARLLLHATRRD